MSILIAVVVSLVAGGVAGYAFRGKEHAALQSASKAVQAGVSDVAKKL